MEDPKLTMLIIDDEIEILKLFKDIFEVRGWNVFTAPIGESGLAIIEKERLDMVLLDIRLPDIQGIDILKKIRKGHKNLPVIMITALGYADNLVNESIRSGASGYVSKGVPIQELIEVIKNALVK